MGETLGKRLWPGEKRAGEAAMELGGFELGGWNADGKDLRIGVSPAMLNIGLPAKSSNADESKVLHLKAAEAVRAGRRDSRAGWRNGEGN